jgi:hypothetical protein
MVVPRIVVGGIFRGIIRGPETPSHWYERHLGLNRDGFGLVLVVENPAGPNVGFDDAERADPTSARRGNSHGYPSERGAVEVKDRVLSIHA